MTDSSANPRNYGEPPLHEDDPLMELSRIMDFGAPADDDAWAARNERRSDAPQGGNRAEPDFDAALDLERELMGAFDEDEPQQGGYDPFAMSRQNAGAHPEAEPIIDEDELASALEEEMEPHLDMDARPEAPQAPEPLEFEDADRSEPVPQFDYAGYSSARDSQGDAYSGSAEEYDPTIYQPAIEPHEESYLTQNSAPTAWDVQPAEPVAAPEAPQAVEPLHQPLSLEDELESLLFTDGNRDWQAQSAEALAPQVSEPQAPESYGYEPAVREEAVSYDHSARQAAESDFGDFDLEIEDEQPVAAAPAQAEQSTPAGYPYYTRGNFASGAAAAAPSFAQPAAAEEPAAAKDDFDFDDFSFDTQEQQVAESTDDDLSGLDDLTLNDDDFGFEPSGDAGAKAAQPQDDIEFSEEDFFAEDDFVAEEAEEETAAYAHAVRSDEDHVAPAASAPQVFRVPAPEVETLSVAESKVEQTHSLDLPEVNYGEEEQPSGLTDLEAEFAEVFNTVEVEEPVGEADAQSEADKAFEDIFRESASTYLPNAATGAALGAATAAAATVAYGRSQAPAPARQDNRLAAGTPGSEDDFYNHWAAAPGAQTMEGGDFGARAAAQPDDDLGHAAEAYRNRPVRGRRGLILASVAGAVVLLGGIGYHFIGGGGSGEPVVIRADSQPTKMQPENPGGVTVPNQDKAVYDRVAGTLPNSPEQKALISSGEEPVDISGTDDNENMADDTPETAATNPAQADGGQQPDGGQQANANAPLIQPREVETMIVRPDGTFAPAEQPASPQAQTPAPTPSAVASAPQPSAPSGGDEIAAIAAGDDLPTAATTPQAQAPAEAPAAAQTPQLPVRAPIVPSRPAEQPVNIVGNVPQRTQAPAQQQAAPAAQQVASAAGAGAGAGGYFIQIASQPTAELAQKSYANMAQRYANVIGGRGVDIKRADIPNKGTYYRVRVQAGSREDANALCSRLKSAGGSCLVTR